jgi:hypothetical protein
MKAGDFLVKAALVTTMAALSFPAFSQYSYPSQENIALGEKYKRQFPDDKVYCIKETVVYDFSIAKSTSDKKQGLAVAVKTNAEKELLGLKDNYELQEVEFYDSFSSLDIDRVYRKKGKSYTPLRPDVTDHAYTQNGIFHDDSRLKSLKLPFHTLGDSYKYSFTKDYRDIRYFTSVYFYDQYPIGEKTITFQVPDWLEVELKEMNFTGYSIAKSTRRDEKNKLTIYTYQVANIPGIKEENNAPSWAFTWPHILLIPKQFKAEGTSHNVFSSTEDLYNWYSYLAQQVENKEDVLKPLVAELMKDKKTDQEKMAAIYYWVQDNIKYIAFEDGIAGYQPAPAHKVYETKYGDCKGMANLLKTMLSLAGYDARLTWIGTNGMIPYNFTVPSLAVANHAICTVILNNTYYYLDGTESFVALGDNADRIQGRQVLIEGKDKYALRNIPENDAARNKVLKHTTLQVEDNRLVGKASYTYNGESKTSLLSEIHNMRSELKEDFIKRLADEANKNLQVSNVSYSDINNRSNPLRIDYNFSLDNAIISLEKEMYVTLDHEQTFGSFTVDSTRLTDYHFSEKIMRVSEVEFQVPAGYTVKHVPAPVKIKSPAYEATLIYTQDGNKIRYSKMVSVPTGIIKKTEIRDWNKFVAQLKTSYDDQLILVKQ